MEEQRGRPLDGRREDRVQRVKREQAELKALASRRKKR